MRSKASIRNSGQDGPLAWRELESGHGGCRCGEDEGKNRPSQRDAASGGGCQRLEQTLETGRAEQKSGERTSRNMRRVKDNETARSPASCPWGSSDSPLWQTCRATISRLDAAIPGHFGKSSFHGRGTAVRRRRGSCVATGFGVSVKASYRHRGVQALNDWAASQWESAFKPPPSPAAPRRSASRGANTPPGTSRIRAPPIRPRSSPRTPKGSSRPPDPAKDADQGELRIFCSPVEE